MEDLRDAEHSVAAFAVLIEQLDASSRSEEGSTSAATTRRQNSNNSSERSPKSSSISSRWRYKKKDWDETTEGVLWNELEKPQSDVARKYGVDQTLLKEYISTKEMMDIGAEFAQKYHHHCHLSSQIQQKAYWVAEDLFFDLQAVKQGDADPARWTRFPLSTSSSSSDSFSTNKTSSGRNRRQKDWDLADHLVRFVLLAEQCRLRYHPPGTAAPGLALDFDTFAIKVAFFLSILRCYTIRDAKQRQLASTSTMLRSSPAPSSRSSIKSSRHGDSAPLS
ncbi:hypothetical protein F5Y16DRAFT_174331 [Xylariaceae sp. FL0255]|nr:hypothetical protein F5Y16DRAFT_174331 [Xylariaceae sp. FL0255]